MTKIICYLILISLFIQTTVFGQSVSDSLDSDNNVLNGSLIVETNQDSLDAVNQKTIDHISKIFSNFKDKRPKIGIVLAGGGAKGFAHIGVLQLLDSLHIPVDFIAGNSMGGLVGALYSIGYSGKNLEDFTKGLNWDYLLNDNPPREELPFIEKKRTGRYQLKIGLDGYEPAIPSGLIYGQNVQLLFLSLTAPYEGISNFDELPIPFRCVAVDLVTGKQVVLKNGSLAKAMRATMSIPSAFSPIVWDDYLLVDGLVLNNYPVDVVKEMGADIIIGLNLTTGDKAKEDFNNLLTVFDRMIDIPTSARLQKNIEMTDIYISQDLRGFSTTDFAPEKTEEIIKRGKEAGERNKPVLLALRKELEKYDEFKKWEEKGRKAEKKLIEKTFEEYKASPPLLSSYIIQGNERFTDDFIEHHLKLKTGVSFDNEVLIKKIEELYALNYFESISYKINKVKRNEVHLVIEVKEKLPNRLVAGIKYNDYYKLIGLIGLETNSELIPGAQLETYLRFGGLTTLDATLLYPSRSMDMVVYPFISAHYKDIPLDFYYNGKKIFRFRDRSWRLAGGFNFSLSKFWNFETSLHWEWMNAYTEIATVEIDEILSNFDLNARLVTGKARLLFDSLDDIIIPNNGIYFNSFFETTIPSFGSDLKYSRLFARLDTFLPISKKHNLRLDAAYMKVWEKSETPFYKWFYLGGPETFVGIDYFQANGTEFTLGAISYRYEILESIFLKGVFNAIFNYNLLNGPKSDDLLYGYGISAMMRSILGRIEIMWAQGDENVYEPGKKTNKIYFLLGFHL